MLKRFRKKNNEKGSVSIEATISLTAFLFMFLMIYSIVTICRTQAYIQIAINSTAKEISQYSYLYGLSGLADSLAGFQEKAGETKDSVNGLVGDVVDMFEGVQSLGKTAADAGSKVATIDIADVSANLESWESISAEIDGVKNDLTEDWDTVKAKYSGAREKIEAMAENPQALLLGMAKLLGSEALELGKSRLIAEPVCRALVQKHLKRTNDDTADAFCKAMGIQPGTYLLSDKAYFNGLDFSNSTLFPYGSDEISVIVTYRIKLIELLGVDVEFTITQSAVTKGWLHGDGTELAAGSAESKLEALKANGDSIWNAATLSERVDLIRHMGIEELKAEGYYGVSGETHIQAYEPHTETFVMISSANPLYGITSIYDIDKEAVKENVERLAAQMSSATDNKQKINVKYLDSYGNLKTKTCRCEGTKTKKVILVIPEDAGLKEIYQTAIDELDTDVIFEIQQSYGTALKAADAGETKSEEGGES